MKAIITHLDGEDQTIEFGEYTRIRFDFGDPRMQFIEVGVDKSSNGNPCLYIRSGWNALVIEPIVSNAVKLSMVDS